MSNQWIEEHWRGKVTIIVEGVHPERFVNQCLREGMTLKNIKKIHEEKLQCDIFADEWKGIRRLARQSGCKARLRHKAGWPFLFFKLRKRFGIPLGVLLFAAILYVLSQMVWTVEIEGASPKVEHELKQYIEENGVKRGAMKWFLPPPEDIQKAVTNAIDEATWIGVEVRGTTYHFQVVEQTLPEEAEYLNPRHLVASKKAMIHDLFVEHGQAQVKPNDYVEKGDMLISGFIGKEDHTSIVPAKGEVLGEIWYQAKVEIPQTLQVKELTGERDVRHNLKLFNLTLPVWGISRGDSFEDMKIERDTQSYSFLGYTFPVMWETIFYREQRTFTHQWTEDEAVEIGKEISRKKLDRQLPEDAEITAEKVLHENMENGKVILVIHYKVIEDITSEVPIIQGD